MVLGTKCYRTNIPDLAGNVVVDSRKIATDRELYYFDLTEASPEEKHAMVSLCGATQEIVALTACPEYEFDLLSDNETIQEEIQNMNDEMDGTWDNTKPLLVRRGQAETEARPYFFEHGKFSKARVPILAHDETPDNTVLRVYQKSRQDGVTYAISTADFAKALA